MQTRNLQKIQLAARFTLHHPRRQFSSVLLYKINQPSQGEMQGDIMTLAQQFEQRGMQQGQTTMLLRLLQRRFGEIPADLQKRIQQADVNTLLAWGG